MSFVCRSAGSGGTASIACDHFVSNSRVSVARSEAKVGADSPIDRSGTEAALVRQIKGTADGGFRSAILTTTYDKRRPIEDIYDLFISDTQYVLQLSIYLSEHVTIAFKDAHWDRVTRELTATGVTGNGQLQRRFTCSEFAFFEAQKAVTQCVLWTDGRPPIHMAFKP